MSTHDAVARRFILVAGVLPGAVVAAAVALQVAWIDELPDPVATHWGPSGAPDGFGSPMNTILLTAVIGLGLPALVMAMTLPMLKRGARGATFRFMGAFALGMATFAGVLDAWLLGMQRGLEDASTGPGVGWAMIAALMAGALGGVVGWFLQPHQEASIPGLRPAEPLTLGADERAVWMATATIGNPIKGILIAVMALLAVLTVVLWVAAGVTAGIITLSTLAFIALVFAASTAFHVRVDHEGLSVISALGWPRLSVPAAQIESAGVAPVNGFAEFGGYGIRVAPGATGVVLRNGEALQVVRTSGKRFVVTVDDAGTAAALLETIAKRARRM